VRIALELRRVPFPPAKRKSDDRTASRCAVAAAFRLVSRFLQEASTQ
jgi:hypothetical protein